MENAKKFFEELAKTEEAKSLFAATEKPDTEEELVAIYVDIAKKLGVELTAEEVKEYLAADNADGAELDDEELSQLVGGADEKGNDACKSSFMNEENCWWNDACDNVKRDYGDAYLCNLINKGALASAAGSIVSAAGHISDAAVNTAHNFK